MTDRREHGLIARVRRRLYYRGALLLLGLLYGALTVAVFGLGDRAPTPWLWEVLFGFASVTSLGVVYRPRVRWLRAASGAFAVVAPAAVTLALPIVSRSSWPGIVVSVAPWAGMAILAFVAWPTILPPHIDAARLSERLNDGDG